MNEIDKFVADQSLKKPMINKSQARIVMLDHTEEYFDLKKDDTGKMLYTRVCDFMRLEEKDYFGLMFMNNENTKVNLD
jgi:hypothetical protein